MLCYYTQAEVCFVGWRHATFRGYLSRSENRNPLLDENIILMTLILENRDADVKVLACLCFFREIFEHGAFQISGFYLLWVGCYWEHFRFPLDFEFFASCLFCTALTLMFFLCLCSSFDRVDDFFPFFGGGGLHKIVQTKVSKQRLKFYNRPQKQYLRSQKSNIRKTTNWYMNISQFALKTAIVTLIFDLR